MYGTYTTRGTRSTSWEGASGACGGAAAGGCAGACFCTITFGDGTWTWTSSGGLGWATGGQGACTGPGHAGGAPSTTCPIPSPATHIPGPPAQGPPPRCKPWHPNPIRRGMTSNRRIIDLRSEPATVDRSGGTDHDR